MNSRPLACLALYAGVSLGGPAWLKANAVPMSAFDARLCFALWAIVLIGVGAALGVWTIRACLRTSRGTWVGRRSTPVPSVAGASPTRTRGRTPSTSAGLAVTA